MGRGFQFATKLFQPFNVVPKNADFKGIPKSQKLMMDYGIIKQASNGVFHLLPLGLRSLEKLEKLIDSPLAELGAQKLKLSLLTDSVLWKKSGRWASNDLGLFRIKDRHSRDYLLSPTHEEAVSDLVNQISPVSPHQLPILLYQIATKFRDEIKPRCGLIKGKEFIMKDLYSFHRDEQCALRTYEQISQIYVDLLSKLEVPFVKATALPGDMGGSLSHEFQVLNDIGEDEILVCETCNTAVNKESHSSDLCGTCNKPMKLNLGLEVGHTFLLGTKYSEALNAVFKPESGGVKPLVMASYGLGLTRLLAACVEHYSSTTDIKWPTCLAPFSVVVITPKCGSKEEQQVVPLVNHTVDALSNIPPLHNDVLLDDRNQMTIGKRLLLAKSCGYPTAVVVGKKATLHPPLVELHDLYSGSVNEISVDALLDYFSSNTAIKSSPTVSACVR